MIQQETGDDDKPMFGLGMGTSQGRTRTYVISRQVSCSCSSESIFPVCQSKVATWPFCPTTAICLPLRVYLARYGPPSRINSLRPRAASTPIDLTISSCDIRHDLSIPPSSISIFPALFGRRSSASRSRAFPLSVVADWRCRVVRSFLLAM